MRSFHAGMVHHVVEHLCKCFMVLHASGLDLLSNQVEDEFKLPFVCLFAGRDSARGVGEVV